MPKIVDREEMRAKIMAAAMVVYSDVGVHVATMDAIAKQSGLGKGTVYLYFESKDALTTTLVERIFEDQVEKFIDAELCTSLDEFTTKLRDTMTITKDNARFVRVFFEVFGPSFASDAIGERVAGFFDRLGDHYSDQISHLQRSGEVSSAIAPEMTGRALAAIVDGMILHRGLLSIPGKQHQDMIDTILSVLMRGLRAD